VLSLNIGFQNFDNFASFLNLIDLDSQCAIALSSISSRKTEFVGFNWYLYRISLNGQSYTYQSTFIVM